MSGIKETLPPLIMTYDQLLKTLGPITFGYKWGEETIRDLWLLGAPTPDSGPTTIDKRIVFPSQLSKWLEDVLRRQGRPLTEIASVYNRLASGQGLR